MWVQNRRPVLQADFTIDLDTDVVSDAKIWSVIAFPPVRVRGIEGNTGSCRGAGRLERSACTGSDRCVRRGPEPHDGLSPDKENWGASDIEVEQLDVADAGDFARRDGA